MNTYFFNLDSEITNSVIVVDWKELEIQNELGKGGFGTVYKALWRYSFTTKNSKKIHSRGDFVAVKKLRLEKESQEIIQAFQKETQVLSKMRHSNIVALMAASIQFPNLSIVVELLASDLRSILASKEKLNWTERLNMILDTCRV